METKPRAFRVRGWEWVEIMAKIKYLASYYSFDAYRIEPEYQPTDTYFNKAEYIVIEETSDDDR